MPSTSSHQGCPSSHAATVASIPVIPGDPNSFGGMRWTKRAFNSGEPKCITPQRSPGILNPLVAEVVVIVRAATSGEIDASGMCL